MAINPDATLIPDKAEVWIALKSDVSDISTMIPTTPTADLDALGWMHVGLIDEANGVPVTPAVEVKPYDAFGYPQYRVKLRKGTLKTGFTMLEDNDVTRQIVFPGSAGNRLGIPKDTQIYVLYRFEDEGATRVWVSLRPAPVEISSTAGIVDGEEFTVECVVHHTATADGDVFETVGSGGSVVTFTIGSGVTAYTATVGGQTTSSITTKTASALQTALRALSGVGSTGVTVTGPTGGPLVASFSDVVTVSATGTGGTVTVA